MSNSTTCSATNGLSVRPLSWGLTEICCTVHLEDQALQGKHNGGRQCGFDVPLALSGAVVEAIEVGARRTARGRNGNEEVLVDFLFDFFRDSPVRQRNVGPIRPRKSSRMVQDRLSALGETGPQLSRIMSILSLLCSRPSDNYLGSGA